MNKNATPAFDLTQFSVAPKRYNLVSGSGIEVGGELHQLMERFGNTWKTIPGKKNVFHARGKSGKDTKVQMTLLVNSHGIPVEFAVYTDIEFEEFKELFLNGGLDAAYYPIGDEWCMGGRILTALKANEVW